MKKIAFIGSSGGNLFKQGGNDIHGMMKEILLQTGAADMEISPRQYILASSSLDRCSSRENCLVVIPVGCKPSS